MGSSEQGKPALEAASAAEQEQEHRLYLVQLLMPVMQQCLRASDLTVHVARATLFWMLDALLNKRSDASFQALSSQILNSGDTVLLQLAQYMPRLPAAVAPLYQMILID